MTDEALLCKPLFKVQSKGLIGIPHNVAFFFFDHFSTFVIFITEEQHYTEPRDLRYKFKFKGHHRNTALRDAFTRKSFPCISMGGEPEATYCCIGSQGQI